MTAKITETAKAKVNLALHVLGRRADGYHELDSIVAFAELGDLLSIETAQELSLSCTGRFAGDVPHGHDNIILRAWHCLAVVMARRGVVLPKVHVNLTKNLPVASGIGGGSSDAAALLRGVLALNRFELSTAEICQLAQDLGADVPVCFYGKQAHMQGMGDNVSPLMIEIPRAIVLVNPLVACATPDVFREMGLAKGQIFGTPINLHDQHYWRNDMTTAALLVQPVIATVLAALGEEPTLNYVRMTGSGATCFGLSNSMAQASAAAARLSVKNPNWWVQAAQLG